MFQLKNKGNTFLIIFCLLFVMFLSESIFAEGTISSVSSLEKNNNDNTMNIIENSESLTENHKTKEFPIVVYAGSPEGVAAAVSSARQGVKTLLILKRNRPGGLMTYGGLNYLDINSAPDDGAVLNKGIFAEWHRKVGGRTSFSITKAEDVFEKMIADEKNLTVYRNVKIISVNKSINKFKTSTNKSTNTSTKISKTSTNKSTNTSTKISSDNSTDSDNNNEFDTISANCNSTEINRLLLQTSSGKMAVSADYFIDASEDADLAAASGALYFNGGADIGLPERHMAVTLVLHMGNVNWDRLLEDARADTYGPSYINKYVAWGFVEIGQLYKPVNKYTRLRGLNIVVEDKGENNEVYINALLVFNVNPTDEDSLAKAYQRGKDEAYHVFDFLRRKLKGFEEAELLSFPEELYVRESRHIVARYQLRVEDLFNNRVFPDTVALASYPLDYQASNPDYNGFVLFHSDIYGIPLRSLAPSGIDNLFVVGKSSGYSSLAAASARVLPTGMTTAEAAGIAAAYGVENDLEIDELLDDKDLINLIQSKLEIDELLEKYDDYIGKNLVFPEEDEKNLFARFLDNIKSSKDNSKFPSYLEKELKKHLEYLLSWGLVVGGYDNDFHLNDDITEREFAHIIVKGMQQQDSPILYEWVPGGMETMSSNKPLSRDQAAMLLIVAISKRVSDLNKDEYFSKAIEYGLIPEIISREIPNDRVLNRAEAYILISSFLQKYPIAEDVMTYRGDK